GAWAVTDLGGTDRGNAAWWHATLDGVLLIAGVAVLAQLLYAAAAALQDLVWTRRHLDEVFLYCLVRIRHIATHHRDEWGTAASTRRLDKILENAVTAVERHLRNRLPSERDCGRRIAADLRSRKEYLAR